MTDLFKSATDVDIGNGNPESFHIEWKEHNLTTQSNGTLNIKITEAFVKGDNGHIDKKIQPFNDMPSNKLVALSYTIQPTQPPPTNIASNDTLLFWFLDPEVSSPEQINAIFPNLLHGTKDTIDVTKSFLNVTHFTKWPIKFVAVLSNNIVTLFKNDYTAISTFLEVDLVEQFTVGDTYSWAKNKIFVGFKSGCALMSLFAAKFGEVRDDNTRNFILINPRLTKLSQNVSDLGMINIENPFFKIPYSLSTSNIKALATRHLQEMLIVSTAQNEDAIAKEVYQLALPIAPKNKLRVLRLREPGTLFAEFFVWENERTGGRLSQTDTRWNARTMVQFALIVLFGILIFLQDVVFSDERKSKKKRRK